MARLIGITALFLATSSLNAQTEPVFRANAAAVTVPIAATNQHGVTISDMKLPEFQLFDNNKPTPVDHAGSLHNLDRTLEELQQSGTVVYAIKVGDWRSALMHGLDKLAQGTGGLVLRPKGDDFTIAFRPIEADLRTRYLLGFRPGYVLPSNDPETLQ